jgi:hypothetical protein
VLVRCDDDMRRARRYGNGDSVNFDGFTKLMSARVADSDTQGAGVFAVWSVRALTSNVDAILESFKVLASDKAFVTESDMRSVMDKEQVDYLVAHMPKYKDDGYVSVCLFACACVCVCAHVAGDRFDYVAWVKSAYA